MRRSPSIVPGNHQSGYLVLDDFGGVGGAWRETNVQDTDLEAVIDDLLEGQYSNPIRVIGFNTAEGWSRNVSEDVVDLALLTHSVCASFRNARFLFLGHMPDHDV